jgi:hypothetical protein
MISRATLKSNGFTTMPEYYSAMAVNFIDGKRTMAREKFKALSAKQRKEFISHLATDWQSAAGDPMHDFFFDLL